MEEDKEELDGAKLVASAILGMDYRVLIINSKAYILNPPTIHRLCGATYFLSELGEGKTIKEILGMMQKMDNLAKALSWFIEGNDSISEELMAATPGELIEGLEVAFQMIDAGNFLKLSALRRSARMLIAKPQ